MNNRQNVVVFLVCLLIASLLISLLLINNDNESHKLSKPEVIEVHVIMPSKTDVESINVSSETQPLRVYDVFPIVDSPYYGNSRIITPDELEMLYKMVEAECTGHDISSKKNVTHVILNRVMDIHFPSTIEDVLFQENAFSPIGDNRYYEVEVTNETKQAVLESLYETDTTEGALFFMYRAGSSQNNVTWFDKNLKYIMKDSAGHEFFRMKE